MDLRGVRREVEEKVDIELVTLRDRGMSEELPKLFQRAREISGAERRRKARNRYIGRR